MIAFQIGQLIAGLRTKSFGRIVLMYGLGSWAILGHLDLMTSRFGLPDAYFNYALGVLAVGLVTVLVVVARVKAPGVFQATLRGIGLWFLAVALPLQLADDVLPYLGRELPSVLSMVALLLFPLSIARSITVSDRSRSEAGRVTRTPRTVLRAALRGIGLWFLTAFAGLQIADDVLPYLRSGSELFSALLLIAGLLLPAAIAASIFTELRRPTTAGPIT